MRYNTHTVLLSLYLTSEEESHFIQKSMRRSFPMIDKTTVISCSMLALRFCSCREFLRVIFLPLQEAYADHFVIVHEFHRSSSY